MITFESQINRNLYEQADTPSFSFCLSHCACGGFWSQRQCILRLKGIKGDKTAKFHFVELMDRRTFLKKYMLSMAALPAGLRPGHTATASSIDLKDRHLNQLNMKKIIIVDGGPRRNMNTAQMLRKVAEGALSLGEKIEVKTVRLYDLDYKGCMSCMACKIKGRASNVCKFKDGLTTVLEEIAQADALVLGSPIYFGDVTGQMRTFLERLAFPWLSYNDYSLTAPKRMPVLLVETMNGTPERNNSNGYGSMEYSITAALGKPERLVAYNTYQVKNYDRYELAGFSEEAKRQWRDSHWEEDLLNSFNAGCRIARQIIGLSQ